MSRMISPHQSSSASRTPSRLGILAVLVLAVLLAGCYYYDPYGSNTAYTLSVTSPTASVYTTAPQLSYTAGRDVSVTLNGALVTTVSNGYLNDAVTGLNTLVVTELDSTGGTVTSTEVAFFLNDLSLSDSENWTTDYSDWLTLKSSDSSVNFFFSGTLAVRGATIQNAWGAQKKSYDPSSETECIQAQDVLLIENINASAAVGFLTHSGEMLTAKLVKSGSSAFDLCITEISANPRSPYTVGSATLSTVTAGSPVRVSFYRNGATFQAVAADSSNKILASVAAPASFVPAFASSLRGVVLAPYDSAGNTSTMVEVDNYAYYK